MKFHQPRASIYVPDGATPEIALSRATHIGIGAHPDDLEFHMAHGILECYERADRGFLGITCTDGAGSARTGPYADYTDEQMVETRHREQCEAARIGRYSAVIQLACSSAALRTAEGLAGLIADLQAILWRTRAEVVYTHNPADKHVTHLAVCAAAIAALRALPADRQPLAVYGCEGWRDLDWLPDRYKVILPLNGRSELQAELLRVFASQIAGGKRYDRATLGRRAANATYQEPRAADTLEAATLAMDLRPLIEEAALTPQAWVERHIRAFSEEVRESWRGIPAAESTTRRT